MEYYLYVRMYIVRLMYVSISGLVSGLQLYGPKPTNMFGSNIVDLNPLLKINGSKVSTQTLFP